VSLEDHLKKTARKVQGVMDTATSKERGGKGPPLTLVCKGKADFPQHSHWGCHGRQKKEALIFQEGTSGSLWTKKDSPLVQQVKKKRSKHHQDGMMHLFARNAKCKGVGQHRWRECNARNFKRAVGGERETTTGRRGRGGKKKFRKAQLLLEKGNLSSPGHAKMFPTRNGKACRLEGETTRMRSLL